MKRQSVEEMLQAAGNTVEALRNSQADQFAFPVIPTEFSNWRDEQRAWRDTAALFDLTYHMDNLYIEGPDALKLLSYVSANSYKNFPVDAAKQITVCAYDGYFIGDGILFHLEPELFCYVGLPSASDWIRYQAEIGKYNVKITHDPTPYARSDGRATQRSCYRYQIQGPLAWKVIEKLNGGPMPEIKFFHMGRIKINGREVRALRHGMSGEPGLEIWGPFEERFEIREAILEAGRDFGLLQVGSMAYPVASAESAWIAIALPAIYTGDARMKAYREWLPAMSFEGAPNLGGSYVSSNIEDYYLTPYEIGLGEFVRFDHDFIGREALEKMAAKPHRKKVTLAWNPEDVSRVQASMFEPEPYMYIGMPLVQYTSVECDSVLYQGKLVGTSRYCMYSYNERAILSLAVVDPDVEIGAEVELVWGEENGGTRKKVVEHHRQTTIRAIVSPAPYSRVAREEYAKGWRTEALAR